ncbi:MAG: helix-turn-helix domain-containing protein [Dehalococcoidia bacterium]|jgi:excisionase family DNA binding protein
MTTLPDKELLRPDEVAAYLGVDRKTVYLWVQLGKLEAVKYERLIRIPREAVIKKGEPAAISQKLSL